MQTLHVGKRWVQCNVLMHILNTVIYEKYCFLHDGCELNTILCFRVPEKLLCINKFNTGISGNLESF